MNNKELKVQADNLAAQIGLKSTTVVDLLQSGWSFSETMGHPARFERDKVLEAGSVRSV